MAGSDRSSLAVAALSLLMTVGCGPAAAPSTEREAVVDRRQADEAAPAGVDDGELELGGARRVEIEALAGRCEGGEAAACERAILADKGEALGAERARALLVRGCELGDPVACLRSEDLAAARRLAEAACEAGPGECFALGILRAQYSTDEAEQASGRDQLLAACEAGTARACFTAGTYYEDGVGFDRDLTPALKLYERACEGGHADACNNASTLLYQVGRLKDSCARSLRACSLGHARSCNNAAVCDQEDKRFEEAAAHYRRACSLGDALGCYNLGHLYRRAEGVRRDRNVGVYLLQIACRGGYEPGCNDAEVLAREKE